MIYRFTRELGDTTGAAMLLPASSVRPTVTALLAQARAAALARNPDLARSLYAQAAAIASQTDSPDSFSDDLAYASQVIAGDNSPAAIDAEQQGAGAGGAVASAQGQGARDATAAANQPSLVDRLWGNLPQKPLADLFGVPSQALALVTGSTGPTVDDTLNTIAATERAWHVPGAPAPTSGRDLMTKPAVSPPKASDIPWGKVGLVVGGLVAVNAFFSNLGRR